MGEFLAILALIMFSTNIIITKVASSRLNLDYGFLISVTVNVLFSALLFGLQLFFREETFRWNPTGFLLFLLSGVFSTYLGRWFFFETIAKLGPARASAFQVSNPLFTFLIAWLFLGETFRLLDLAAILMILLGLFLVSYIPQAFSQPSGSAGAHGEVQVHHAGNGVGLAKTAKIKAIVKSGIFMAVAGSLSYALGNVVRGIAIQSWNEPVLGAFLGAVAGIVLHFATNARTSGLVWKEIRSWDRKGFFLYVLSGVLTISAQICLIASMWYIPVAIANLITLSTPVLVTPLSYFLLKNQEGITIRTILGILMVLSGIGYIVAQ